MVAGVGTGPAAKEVATMAVIQKEATAIRAAQRGGRGPAFLWILAMLAIAGVVVAAVTLRSSTRPIGSTGPVTVAPQAGSLYTEQEQAVLRLVAKGYIPAETLNGEPYRTKQLVNEGLVPSEALAPRSAPVEPLYTARERAIMAAVATGQIPRQVLDGEPFRTKRLINQGLIPRAAAGG